MKRKVLLLMEIYEGLIAQNVKESIQLKNSMNMLKSLSCTNAQNSVAEESSNQKWCFMESNFLKVFTLSLVKFEKLICALLLAQH